MLDLTEVIPKIGFHVTEKELFSKMGWSGFYIGVSYLFKCEIIFSIK